MNTLGWLVNYWKDTNAFQRPWQEFLHELGAGQPKEVWKVTEGWRQWRAYGGPVGGMYYDLAMPEFSTQPILSKIEVELITGAAIVAISKADDVIDEHEFSLDERVDMIEQLFTVLKKGKPKQWESPETTAISLLALYIHKKVSTTQYPELYFDEAERMKDGYVQQIKGEISLEQMMNAGSAFTGMLMSIMYCMDSKLPQRFLAAARHFGAYAQLRDDLADVRHDRKRGLQTIITIADSKAVVAQVKSAAKRQYEASLAQLEPAERSFCRALDICITLEQIRTNYFPYKGTFVK